MKRKVVLIVIAIMVFAKCNPTHDSKKEANADSLIHETFNPDMEPIGGQPAFDSRPSVVDLDYQVKYQRAFETALWAMPAVAIYRFRGAAFEGLGLKDNDVIVYSAVAKPNLEALTANSATPYITAFSDLSKGPTVLEIPEANDQGSLYGQVVDHWQITIADVGPAGLDKGKKSKYIFTPPNFKGTIPRGYLHVASPSYRIAFAFRSVRGPGKSVEDAYQYAKQIRMYRISEAVNPPEQKFVDPINDRYPTLPIYNEQFFSDMHAIFSLEEIKPADKMMMGMLRSLGIEHGNNNFNPDELTKKAMKNAIVDVWHYLQQRMDNVPAESLFWKDRHYISLIEPDRNREFTFEYKDHIDIDAKASLYTMATYLPKKLSETPATMYITAVADNKGNPLKKGATYKINVPAEMPVSQFWSITVYDRATYSFIYSDISRTSLSSYDLPNMKENEDGSVDVYIGPEPVKGYENNWIPTRGKRPFPTFRFYGPTAAFNNKTFQLNDFELVN